MTHHVRWFSPDVVAIGKLTDLITVDFANKLINLNKVSAFTINGVPLNSDAFYLDIADASAEAVYYIVCPFAGTITSIYTVADSAVLSADVTITSAIGATGITGGVITIAVAGAAAGDVDSCAPTAANVVTAGQAVNFTVTGGGSAGTGPRIHLTMVIARS